MNFLVRCWVCFFLTVCVFALSSVTAKAQPRSGPVVFFALGDQGTGKENQRRVAQAMERVAARQVGGVDGVLLLGDNFYPDGVSSVDDPQWQTKFETIYAGPILAKIPFYATLGNHDVRSDPAVQIDYARKRLGSGRWHMDGHLYSLDQGVTASGQPLLRIVVLDGNLEVQQQGEFVQQAFSPKTRQPVWRLVANHYPLRSSAKHGNSEPLLTRLLPVLQAERVDVYLCGHDHDLELLQPPGEPLQIVSGAGGQKLYSMEKKSPWSKFFAKSFGFVRIEATAATLAVTLFNDGGEVIYQTHLDAPNATTATRP
ncbi:MAG: acid phosphatase [Magnetococcales bacterium]|nr:acid phosphatase [Magnetococcales bacterium]